MYGKSGKGRGVEMMKQFQKIEVVQVPTMMEFIRKDTWEKVYVKAIKIEKKIVEKIHVLDERAMQEGKARYACTWAVFPTYAKSTTDVQKVTCKNCLRILKRRNE